MENTSVSMVFRIDRDLKTAFEQAAKAQDQTASQLLRKYIRWEVEKFAKEHAQKDLFKPATGTKESKQEEKNPDKEATTQGKNALLAIYKNNPNKRKRR